MLNCELILMYNEIQLKGRAHENELLCIAYATDDAQEGGDAFLHHRKPEFNKH